jgi:hypothetical protein
MAPRIASPEVYAEEMGELWTELSRSLTRLDRLAAEPDRLEHDSTVASLSRLRYSLHLAAEHTYGVAPPIGAESAHAELGAALAAARDATAEVAEAALDSGPEGVRLLVPEWRGALFRVRLARLRLASPAPHPESAGVADVADGIARPLTAFLLALGGAVAFALGATLGYWPAWVVGLVGVCISVLVYRP